MNETPELLDVPAGPSSPSPVMASPVGTVAAVPAVGALSPQRPALGPTAQPATATPAELRPDTGAWVYGIGRLAPRFPDLGVEKEFAQAAGGVVTGELVGTDQLRTVLSQAENAYLARLMCWVFVANGVEVFMLGCRDEAEAARFVEALPAADDAHRTVQVVVGVAGPAVPRHPCEAAGLPVVWVDHMLTFTVDEFIDALAAEAGNEDKDQAVEGKPAEQRDDDSSRRAAKDLFARLTQRSGNWGVTDEDRARNYAALRYSQLYHLAADAYRDNKALLGVEVRASASPDGRRLVAVRLVFRGRRTDVVERYYCLIDVTDRFPFLAASLTAVYE